MSRVDKIILMLGAIDLLPLQEPVRQLTGWDSESVSLRAIPAEMFTHEPALQGLDTLSVDLTMCGIDDMVTLLCTQPRNSSVKAVICSGELWRWLHDDFDVDRHGFARSLLVELLYDPPASWVNPVAWYIAQPDGSMYLPDKEEFEVLDAKLYEAPDAM